MSKMLGVISFTRTQSRYQTADVSPMLQWLDILFAELPLVIVSHFYIKINYVN